MNKIKGKIEQRKGKGKNKYKDSEITEQKGRMRQITRKAG